MCSDYVGIRGHSPMEDVLAALRRNPRAAAVGPTRQSLPSPESLQAFGDPHLDQGLPRDAKARRLAIE